MLLFLIFLPITKQYFKKSVRAVHRGFPTRENWYTNCDVGYTNSAQMLSEQSVNSFINSDMRFPQVNQICSKNRIYIRYEGGVHNFKNSTWGGGRGGGVISTAVEGGG